MRRQNFGHGVPFDDVPGTGTISDTDEWLELFNISAQAIDLTNWSIEFMDYATGYLWNFGDGSTSTEAQPVHFYTRPGAFDVSLTIQTDLGSATITFDDYINVQPHFITPAPLLALNGPEFAIKSTGGRTYADGICGRMDLLLTT
ncbi:MAG: PKD domain-containing protein [bacterium]